MDFGKVIKFTALYYKMLFENYRIGFSGNLDEILYNLLLEMEEAIKEGHEGNYFMDEDSFNEIRAEYLYRLFILLPRIEKNNLQDKLFGACSLFTRIMNSRADIPAALELYFFPQDMYLRDKRFYYSTWESIIRNYIEDTGLNLPLSYPKLLDPKMKLLIDEFVKYGEDMECTTDNWRQRDAYEKYAKIVIPYLFKEGYNPEILPKVFDYAFNHTAELDEYCTLNAGDDDLYMARSDIYDMDEGIADRIINGAMGNNVIIR